MATQGCFDANPDITGLGTRINLYVSGICIGILPVISSTSAALKACRTIAAVTCLALVVTAIVRTAQNKPPLYHALFIESIVFFFGNSLLPTTFLAIRQSPQGPRRWWTVFWTVCIAEVSFGWALYLWAKAPNFGPPDTAQCNDQIRTYIWFISVRTTSLWFRVLVMVGFGLDLIAIPILFLRAALTRDERSPKRFSSWHLIILVAPISGIVAIESFLRNNRHLEIPNDDETWNFGQIVSLVMTVGTLNEVLHFLIPFISSRYSPLQQTEDTMETTPSSLTNRDIMMETGCEEAQMRASKNVVVFRDNDR